MRDILFYRKNIFMKLNNSNIGIIHKNRTFVKMQLIAKTILDASFIFSDFL